MQAKGTAIALVALAFCTALPAAAQTVTMQAESMTLSNYSIENGTSIRVSAPPAPGTATGTFTGASGTYKMQVYVIAEDDGQSTLDVYRGSTLLKSYAYPLANALANFTIDGVALNSGDTIKLVGTANLGAVARVDRIVFTSTAPASTTPASSSAATFTLSSVNLVTNDVIRLIERANSGAMARVGRLAFTPVAGSTPPPTTTDAGTTPPPPSGTLPSTNTKAIATFESLGLYWTPPSNPGSAGCNVKYRKAGESAWKNGLAMWYDSRNSECRGSIVYLTPGTDYQVQFSLPGQQPSAQLAARTWSESFPIARTVAVSSSAQTLTITEGGSPSGYVRLHRRRGRQHPRRGQRQRNNVTIDALLRDPARLHAQGRAAGRDPLCPTRTDVVIEDNDISGWGRTRDGTCGGQTWTRASAAAARAAADASSASPSSATTSTTRATAPTAGPTATPRARRRIAFEHCGGNHVIRHNEMYSSDGNYFNDVIGGEDNFTTAGFPQRRHRHLRQHAIARLGRRASRPRAATATCASGATTSTAPPSALRPRRPRWARSTSSATSGTAAQFYEKAALDSDDRQPFFKSGGQDALGHGRRYMFHNTMLQARRPGLSTAWAAAAGSAARARRSSINNTGRANNIYHLWKDGKALHTRRGTTNDVRRRHVQRHRRRHHGRERHQGDPEYASGHGWQSEAGGNYQLAPGSPGVRPGREDRRTSTTASPAPRPTWAPRKRVARRCASA